MKKVSNYFIPVICFLLILLWVYAASSKLMDFGLFKIQMNRQILPLFLKSILVFALPPVEIGIAILLLFKTTQYAGLILSSVLLFIFTIYIMMAVLKVLGKVPCSCGGILSSMGWGTHLIFNSFYLLLTGFGIYMANRERRLRIHSK